MNKGAPMVELDALTHLTFKKFQKEGIPVSEKNAQKV